MTRPLVVLPKAAGELLAVATLYESKRAGLGIELVAAVDEALQAIYERPRASPRWRGDPRCRQCNVRRFPYLVFYTDDEGPVRVVAIAHVKRGPSA